MIQKKLNRKNNIKNDWLIKKIHFNVIQFCKNYCFQNLFLKKNQVQQLKEFFIRITANKKP